ncbi:hypothetical protein DPMN_173614 [Dreissena polymorpha]|uniref:Uncharacterized protein n=1 Tax=Dreissena polymorpha TaxID=45954 RepID=A0A9D4E315_DREPO|nr:hypothetical protein DPMN_173614 [Dreissena polymorpha]
MEPVVHYTPGLAIAAVAMVILLRTSAVLVPPLAMVAPKFLKRVTSSSFSPFIVMSALVLVVLFSMIFDFSVLTSTPHAPSLS